MSPNTSQFKFNLCFDQFAVHPYFQRVMLLQLLNKHLLITVIGIVYHTELGKKHQSR